MIINLTFFLRMIIIIIIYSDKSSKGNNPENKLFYLVNGLSRTQATKCTLACSPPLKKL